MPTGTAWNDEEIAQLRELHKSGLSCGKISKSLGKSRNAVCGKIHRLKLQLRGQIVGLYPRRVKKADRQPSALKQPFKLRPVENEIGHPNSPYERARIRHEAKAAAIEAPPQPRGDRPTLMQLKPRDCRWPYGDPRHPSFHFCGAPKADKGPYCAPHAKEARATPGTGFKFDDDDDRLILALWNRGQGLQVLAARLGRPTAVVARHAVVELRLPRAA